MPAPQAHDSLRYPLFCSAVRLKIKTHSLHLLPPFPLPPPFPPSDSTSTLPQSTSTVCNTPTETNMSTRREKHDLQIRPYVDHQVTSEIGKTDVRAMTAVDSFLWCAERRGGVAIRSIATGETLRTVSLGEHIFANTFATFDQRLWVGCSDGTVRSFTPNGKTHHKTFDLNTPSSSSKPNQITALCGVSTALFVGTESGTVLTISYSGTHTQIFPIPDAPLVHISSIKCFATRPGIVYIGNESGHVLSCSPDSPEVMKQSKVHRSAVSDMLWVPDSDTLWVGGCDGRVVVLDAVEGGAWDAPLATLNNHKEASYPADSQPVVLSLAGTHVLSGGVSGDVLIWSAHAGKRGTTETGLVCTVQRLHHGSARQICYVSSQINASVFTYGADKVLNVLKLPGQEVSAQPSDAVNLQNIPNALRNEMQRSFVLAKECTEGRARLVEVEAANTALQREVADLKARRIVDNETNGRLLAEAEVEAGGVYNYKKQIAILRTDVEQGKSRSRRLEADVAAAERTTQLAEETHRELKLKIDSLNNTIKTLHSDAEKKAKELTSATSKVKMLEVRVADKGTSAEAFTKQLSDSKDEVLRKDVLLKKAESANKEYEKNVGAEKAKISRLENQGALQEAQIKTLKAQLLVKTDETHELLTAKNVYKTKLARAAGDLETAIRVIESEEFAKNSVADTAVLARNEADILRRERDELLTRSSSDRAVGVSSDSMVHRLKSQLSQMQDALNSERSNNKLLEDQYTVFQFVINSRGELVTSIWAFHDLVQRVKADMKALDEFVRRVLSASMRTSDRDSIATLSSAVKGSAAALEEKCSYVVSNYFTEYEKLHFGISGYHFSPDMRRPQVAGDVLSKLSQVTPQKQYRGGASSIADSSHLGRSGKRAASPLGRTASVDSRRSLSPRIGSRR